MSNSEMRLNPFTDEWIIYSPSRQQRPDRNTSKCPFCEGSEEVPEFKNPLRLNNKFPSLSLEESPIQYSMDELHVKRGAYGKCEIVIYTSKHNAKFTEMDSDNIMKIFETWMQATRDLAKNENINYILPFENYGSDVGASIIHPHGQIYALPFVPPIIQKELTIYSEYHHKYKKCVMCDYLEYEHRSKERIILEDNFCTALIPYFATTGSTGS